MTSFTNTFGGSAISPADVAYKAYSFGTDLTLYWPQFANGQPNVAARFMNMTATAGSLNVIMPDATLVSVGYDVLMVNIGSNTFNLVNNTGGAIVTIAAGQAYYVNLTDNTTQAGTWQVVQFGVGTGSAVASALAGAGLSASAGLLQQNILGVLVSNSYSITAAQRAILQTWNGGSGTITLPTAASVGNGFFFPVANDGSGTLTIATSGGDQIDGGSSSVFAQSQSAFIISTGTAWFTVGKGIANTFSVTLLNLNVGGSADVTLTSAQAQNIIQQYTGVLTGNINVIVPNTVQLYYVYNNTSGAYTLTVKTAAGTGILATQSQHVILYCDGTNVVNAYTAAVGSSVSLIAGSASSPSLNFQGSPTTGLYSPASNQIAISANAGEVMNFTSAASAVNYLQAAATATGNSPVISAQGTDSNINIVLTAKGTGSVNIAKAAITGGAVDGAVIGGSTPAAITGTLITATSNFAGNLTGNVTGNCTGTSGSTTGNAATATALATPRAINGVNFDGTAPITVTAAAGTLSGGTLAAGVLASSLTSVGTLANLTVTNPISGSVTGNAATVTTNANLTGDVTSVGNATTVTKIAGVAVGTPTGTGNVVMSNSPTLVTPALGTPASGNLANCTGISLSSITASLGADVTLNNTANYFDGPSVAQGSTGTWFASGTVTLTGGNTYYLKLWDGTTVIASAVVNLNDFNFTTCASLSGYLASPAGNIRISVRDTNTTTGKIIFNTTGNSKDSTISAFRVA